jgi:hypothetical protein
MGLRGKPVHLKPQRFRLSSQLDMVVTDSYVTFRF